MLGKMDPETNQISMQQSTPVPITSENGQTTYQTIQKTDSISSERVIIKTESQPIVFVNVKIESPIMEKNEKQKGTPCTCPNCLKTGQKKITDPRKLHNCHIPGCNKVFLKTYHLQAHLHSHSGERPYICNWLYCEKSFTRVDCLQRHTRTHTKEARFVCTKCNIKFIRKDYFTKHIKKHHKKRTKKTNVEDIEVKVEFPNSEDEILGEVISDMEIRESNQTESGKVKKWLFGNQSCNSNEDIGVFI